MTSAAETSAVETPAAGTAAPETAATGRIAAIVGTDSASAQALFAATAAEWQAAGTRVAGVVSEARAMPDRYCSAGFLRDIASDRRYPIYLEDTPSGTSCHLDATGVEAACAAVRASLAGSEAVILSKFGKLEAQRRGLADAFAAAIASGKPLLTTVSQKHREAWQAMVPDAVMLPADAAAIRDWWRAVRMR